MEKQEKEAAGEKPIAAYRPGEGFRCDTKPSMLRRCRGWDYRQPCIYMIMLVLADRRSQALGRVGAIARGLGASAPSTEQAAPSTEQAAPSTGQAAPSTGQAAPSTGRAAPSTGRARLVPAAPCSVPVAEAAGYLTLSPAGEAVMREWLDIAAHHPEVKPLFMQVMPDHVHFILQVLSPMEKPLGNVIGGFKAGSSKAAIGRPGLWAEGFQDMILFHEGQLDAMFHYLRDNPRRLAVKRLYPNLFKVRRNFEVKLEALQAPAHFSAIGNHFLLDAPIKLQVQCSRSLFAYRRQPKPGGGKKISRDEHGNPIAAFTTPAFEEKRDELLAAAKHGAVLVSPCISDGEREIARLAFAAGANIIALKNMGFSPLYKPGGMLFDKTANGKLLLLAPAAWPYQTTEKPMTRFDACVLNRIAQLIAGEGAAEINYKGVKPNYVDRLVHEAIGRGAGKPGKPGKSGDSGQSGIVTPSVKPMAKQLRTM